MSGARTLLLALSALLAPSTPYARRVEEPRGPESVADRLATSRATAHVGDDGARRRLGAARPWGDRFPVAVTPVPANEQAAVDAAEAKRERRRAKRLAVACLGGES